MSNTLDWAMWNMPMSLSSSLVTIYDEDILPQVEVEEPPEEKEMNQIIGVIETNLVLVPEVASALLVAGNILVLIFAFCGGCAAIVVCTRSKFTRPGTRFFLISLALSDFLLASFSIVAALSQILERHNSWILGWFMCIVTDYIQTFAMMTNGCCLIAISVDRYLTVVRGMKAPLLSPKCSSYCSHMFMALIWIIPMAISVPMLYGYYMLPFHLYQRLPDDTGFVTNNVTHYVCTKKTQFLPFDKWYHIALGLLFLALIVTFIFSYVSILVFIKQNFQRRPGDHPVVAHTSSSGTNNYNNNNSHQNNNNNLGEFTSTTSGMAGSGSGNTNNTQQQPQPQNRHRRTVRLIMTLIFLFLVCRIPVWLFLVLTTAHKIETTEAMVCLNYTLILLSNVKSAINPFLYTIKNDALRSHNHHGVPHGTSSQQRQNQQLTTCCRSFHSNFGTCKLMTWASVMDYGCCCWRNRGHNMTSYDLTRETSRAPPLPSVDTQRFYASDKPELPSKNDMLTANSSAS